MHRTGGHGRPPRACAKHGQRSAMRREAPNNSFSAARAMGQMPLSKPIARSAIASVSHLTKRQFRHIIVLSATVMF